MWWIGSGVDANFTGCVVDLATWMDSCCKSWKLWHQKVNKITRSFMKAGLLEQQENMWLAKVFQDQAGTDNGFILDIHFPPKQQPSGPSLQQVRPANSGNPLLVSLPPKGSLERSLLLNMSVGRWILGLRSLLGLLWPQLRYTHLVIWQPTLVSTRCSWFHLDLRTSC